MKIDAMSIAALSVAGLAVFAFMRRQSEAAAAVAPATGADMVYATAISQRRDVGASLSMNTDYLANWKQLDGVFASQPDFYI
jgi:hypothetical protein